MRQRNAFTLIELLVVVAIIALLLSILLPSLERARDLAKNVVCQSNLRQVALGCIYYAEDNNGHLMEGWDSRGGWLGDNPGGTDMWVHLISPYMGSEGYEDIPAKNKEGAMQILLCPVTELPKGNPDAFACGTAAQAWRYYKGSVSSYGFNGWLYGRRNNSNVDLGYPLWQWWPRFSTVRQDVPMVGDCVIVDGLPQNTDSPAYTLANPGYWNGYLPRYCIDRHNMAINMAFSGGHIKQVQLYDLWSLRWHQGSRPNTDIIFPW